MAVPKLFGVLLGGFSFLIELLEGFFSSTIQLLGWSKGIIGNIFGFNSKKHAGPRTAIGKEYEWINSADKHRRPSPAAIRKVNHFDKFDNEGEEVLSVPYGPFYRAWDKNEMWKILKEKAWNHVLETTPGKKYDIESLYYEEVKKVEVESRELYSRDDSIDLLSSHDFIWMMILDGCFLLQVALAVLGGFKRLNHLRDFQLLIPTRNEEQTPKDKSKTKKKKEKNSNNDQKRFRVTSMIRVAVSSMFVVGNQIPLVVLKLLMRQNFFTKFVRQGIWEEPVDLERWVLYELLLVPMFHGGREGEIIPTGGLLDHLIERQRSDNIEGKRRQFWLLDCQFSLLSIFEAMRFRGKNDGSINAKDLLHGFWLLMTGLADSDEDGDVDNEVVINSKHGSYHLVPDSHSSYHFILPTVRSATELKTAGVDFRYKKGTKIKGIKFRNYMLNTSLVLPRITMVSEKEMYKLLHNLIQYEDIRFGGSRREMCEYLQLMCGLIRSADDAKVLNADGIIVVHPDDLEKNVVRFFQQLENIPQLMRNHGSLIRSVRDELNDYIRPSPFKKLGVVLNVVAVLTVIQTVFSVFSYVLPRK